MRTKHTTGPETGPQKTAVSKQKCLAPAENQKATIDLIPRKGSQRPGELNPQERSAVSDFQQKIPQKGGLGSEARTLSESLRWWADNHNWTEPDFATNWLRIQLAFADRVRTAVNEFAADGRDGLALLIKTEFAELLETAQSLDRACVKRINAEYEMVKMEHIEEQLQQALVDLAAMLESGCLAPAGDKTGKSGDARCRSQRKIVDVAPASKNGEWITYAEAAKLLLVDKSTVSRLVERGILESNDRKGKWRRVSKGSVLIKKQQDDDERERRRDKGENNFK